MQTAPDGQPVPGAAAQFTPGGQPVPQNGKKSNPAIWIVPIIFVLLLAGGGIAVALSSGGGFVKSEFAKRIQEEERKGFRFAERGRVLEHAPKNIAGHYEIPEGVTRIGDNAFSDCDLLKTITIPSSVTSIGDYAFYNCYSLYFVSKPRGVTSVGEVAFRYAGCEDTMKIYLHLPDPKDSRK